MNYRIKYYLKQLLVLIAYTIVCSTIIQILPWSSGSFLKNFFIAVSIVCGVCIIVYTLWDLEVRTEDDYMKLLGNKPFIKLNGKFWILTLLTVIIFAFALSIPKLFNLYNQTTVYKNQFEQKMKERLGFFDKLWETYDTKTSLTLQNKETFIEVAKIIMENRRDGANLSWKWLTENQKIPFEEFTVFYKDLSSYIETQRSGYQNLEMQCLQIATSHNILIKTYPSKLYNVILNIKPLEFEYGYLNEKTKNTFK